MSKKIACTKLVGEEYEYLNKYFTHKLRHGYIKCENSVLPEYFEMLVDKIQNLNIRNDDIWVISYPKSGTTWVQEMVWCIMNDMDMETAKEPLFHRFPFLEISMMMDFRNFKGAEQIPKREVDSVDNVNSSTSPRLIKTHLPFQLLPKSLQTSTETKIIYVLRNAADTCVSYYYHTRWFEGYKGGFEEFCELFMGDKITYAPYWDHVSGFWNQKDRSNILIIKYEDMKKDLRSVISRVCDFLGKVLSDEQINLLLDHLSFESMKNNKAINSDYMNKFASRFNITDESGEFVRSGKVGEWRTTMKPELRERIEEWIKINLQRTNISLDL